MRIANTDGAGATAPAPSSRASVPGECLALRAWALGVFTGAEPTAHALWPRVAECSPAAWQTFISTEACARPLAARLRAAGVVLPPVAQAELARAELRELQRVMSARVQLAQLDAMAGELGVQPVILKGGAVVMNDATALDLGDLDVLVNEGDAHSFAERLDAAGYAAPGLANARHLAPRKLAGALSIELHTTIALENMLPPGLVERSSPLAGFATLRRLGGVDHLVHVVHHAGAEHPHRCGHLRDLLAIMTAAAALDASELRDAREALALDRAGPTLLALLDHALALAAGRASPDPFRRTAFAKYTFATRRARGAISRFEKAHLAVYATLADPRRSVRTALRILLVEPAQPTSFWYIRAIGRRSPAAARALGAVVRIPYRLLSTLVTTASLATLERSFTRALRAVPPAPAG